MGDQHDHDCDVVGIMEISGRTGAPRERVSAWNKARALPEPRWTIGRAPAWCWHELLVCPVVAVYLPAVKRDPASTWPDLFAAVERAEGLAVIDVDEARYRSTVAKIGRAGGGWVAVGSEDGRVVITDAGQDVELAVDARGVLERVLLDVEWDWPSPTIGGAWAVEV